MLLILIMAQAFGRQPAPRRPPFLPKLVVDKLALYQVPLRVFWSDF